MKRKTTYILLIMALMLSNVQASPVMASEEYTSDVVSDEDEILILSDDLSDEQEVIVEEQQDVSGVSDGEDLFQDSETDFEEDDETDEGFSYEIRNDEVTITGYNGDAQNGMNIPEMMEGYPVTSIKSRAFAKVDNFSGTLVIPSTVTYIGKNIFVKREYSDDEYNDEMSYLRSGSYFLRIENLSDVPLDMNQFAGRWYDLQNKEMLTEEQSLKNGAAVLVPYLDFFSVPAYARAGEKKKIFYSLYPDNTDEECPSRLKITSSDPSVVQVDDQGYFMPLRTGTATITGTDLTGRSLSRKIEVIKNKAEIRKNNITWYIPEEIGLGYEITSRRAGPEGISIARISGLSEDSVGKFIHMTLNGEQRIPESSDDHFAMPHAGDMDLQIYDASSAFAYAWYDTAVLPGTVSFQLKLGTGEKWTDDQKIGKPYTVKIKKPTISTNEPRTGYVGESFSLKAELKDTALKNDLVSKYKKGKTFYHKLVYQPTFEILEGASCIRCSEKDVTHMLTASEKISFRKTGTVKIRIKYNPVFMCDICKQDKSIQYYVPQKTIILNIKKAPTSLKTVKLGKVRSVGHNKLRLTWSKVPNATGYIIYRKNGNKWEKIAVTAKNSYTHVASRKWPIRPGHSYTYTVRAYRKNGKNKIYGGYNKAGMKGKIPSGKKAV